MDSLKDVLGFTTDPLEEQEPQEFIKEIAPNTPNHEPELIPTEPSTMDVTLEDPINTFDPNCGE